MIDNIKKTINAPPEEIRGMASTPATEYLFKVRIKGERKLLDDKQAQVFHTTISELLFVTTRCRQDIQTPVTFLCTPVREPDEDNWKKLRQLLKYYL